MLEASVSASIPGSGGDSKLGEFSQEGPARKGTAWVLFQKLLDDLQLNFVQDVFWYSAASPY